MSRSFEPYSEIRIIDNKIDTNCLKFILGVRLPNTYGTSCLRRPIHHLSGKISKKYRTCYNYRKQSDRKYTSVHGERSTPVTEKEQTWRSQFAQIAAATRERMIDPAFLPGDQAAYAKQSKFKTFRAFVFNICKEEVLNGK